MHVHCNCRPKPPTSKLTETMYTVDLPNVGDEFSFAVSRAGEEKGQKLFSTAGHSFMFKDQLLDITTAVDPVAALFGIGESTLPGGIKLPRNGKVCVQVIHGIISVFFQIVSNKVC